MAGRWKSMVPLVFILILVGLLLGFREDLTELWTRLQSPKVPEEQADSALSSAHKADGPDGSGAPNRLSRPFPEMAPDTEPRRALTEELPPSPPLPDIPPEATQAERRRAFHLEKSVDHIVRRDEPFEAAGVPLTIAEMERALGKPPEPTPILSPIEERDIGEVVRKPILESGPVSRSGEAYYGVRVVRPGENLWHIHYGIVREYFERRGVILPVYADRPTPDGRSSGVGRLLKFMETIVRVYDVQNRRTEGGLDLIHPRQSLVYFRISELFDALDQLEGEDLRWLRFVKYRLILESPGGEQRGLLERGSFFDR